MLLPSLVLVFGLAAPVGLFGEDALAYERIRVLVERPLVRLGVFAIVSLLFWHAMHRIFHGLHDLGVHRGLKAYRRVCYGAAVLASAVTAGLLLLL